MPLNLFDFGGFPSREQRSEIFGSLPFLQDMRLEIIEKSDSNETMYIDEWEMYLEFNSWLRQFNNRIGEVKLSYLMSMYYYNMGIPDGEWHISPGKNGESIQYFPNFKEESFCIKYYFDYHSDVFYYKIFGVWDSIIHLINIYYRINIFKFDSYFKQTIIKALKTKNPSLHSYLSNLSKNKIYRKANTLRNNLTHNFPSNDIDPGVERIGNGITIHKVGNYVTSKEFKENMDGILELLWKTLKKLQMELSPTV